MAKVQSKIPLVNSFCGCVSLENATIFILWVSVIFGILLMFLPSGTIRLSGSTPPPEYWESLAKTQESWLNLLGDNYIQPELIPQIADPGMIEGEINIGNTWFTFPMGVITLFVSAVGLYGIFEENDPKYLFPYLSWCATCFGIFLILSIFSPTGLLIIGFLLFALHIGFVIYCLLVVYSFYCSMKTKGGKYRRVQTDA